MYRPRISVYGSKISNLLNFQMFREISRNNLGFCKLGNTIHNRRGRQRDLHKARYILIWTKLSKRFVLTVLLQILSSHSKQESKYRMNDKGFRQDSDDDIMLAKLSLITLHIANRDMDSEEDQLNIHSLGLRMQGL